MSRTTAHDQRTGEATETVAVVIPTLNEERSIGTVIDDVPVADLSRNGLKIARHGCSHDALRYIKRRTSRTL